MEKSYFTAQYSIILYAMVQIVVQQYPLYLLEMMFTVTITHASVSSLLQLPVGHMGLIYKTFRFSAIKILSYVAANVPINILISQLILSPTIHLCYISILKVINALFYMYNSLFNRNYFWTQGLNIS